VGSTLGALNTDPPATEAVKKKIENDHRNHSSDRNLQVGKGGLPGTWQWFRIKRVKDPPGKGVVNHPVFTSKSVTAVTG
jgi:hypothetical protein